MRTTGAAQLDVHRSITPDASIRSTSALHLAISVNDNRYGASLIGAASPVSISCITLVTHPRSSLCCENTSSFSATISNILFCSSGVMFDPIATRPHFNTNGDSPGSLAIGGGGCSTQMHGIRLGRGLTRSIGAEARTRAGLGGGAGGGAPLRRAKASRAAVIMSAACIFILSRS